MKIIILTLSQCVEKIRDVYDAPLAIYPLSYALRCILSAVINVRKLEAAIRSRINGEWRPSVYTHTVTSIFVLLVPLLRATTTTSVLLGSGVNWWLLSAFRSPDISRCRSRRCGWWESRDALEHAARFDPIFVCNHFAVNCCRYRKYDLNSGQRVKTTVFCLNVYSQYLFCIS